MDNGTILGTTLLGLFALTTLIKKNEKAKRTLIESLESLEKEELAKDTALVA